MTFLLGFFGFFAVLSVAALIKFSGNPVFLFTLLLCLASLVTLWRADQDEAKPSPAGRGTRRARGRRAARSRSR